MKNWVPETYQKKCQIRPVLEQDEKKEINVSEEILEYILEQMTMDEKIAQLTQLTSSFFKLEATKVIQQVR